MREKFRQFMVGRYGTDGLNQALSIASIVMLLISLLTRISLFTWLGLVLLILCYYRSLSRNISKRTEENYRYYTLKDRVDQVPPEAPGAPGPWPHPDLLPPLRYPVHQKELSHVWICDPEPHRPLPGGAGALPHRLLRAVPPHRRAARAAGAVYAELRSHLSGPAAVQPV